jgi:geranylgeranyl diphosphate synthase, type II
MHSIEYLQKVIEKEINLFSQELESKNNLYKPLEYILQLGGKKIRPTLCLLSCELFGGNHKDAIPAALAIELFHNFSLMHDDIMDNAPLRRGKKTVHENWNNSTAILSGDAMLVKSYQEILKIPSKNLFPILDLFNNTALEVCEGQFLDMEFEKSNEVTIDDYIEMIRLKTSVLLATSLKIGAMIAGADENNCMNLYQYGESLGIAFQLQDDLMDAYADNIYFGKQIGGDIISNKKTYLLLKALNKSNIDQKNQIKLLIATNEKDNNDVKITKMKEIYNSLNIPRECEKEIQMYYKKSLQHLDRINISSERKQVLESFATKLMDRKN